MRLGAEGAKLIKGYEEKVLFTYDDAFNPPRPYNGGSTSGTLTIGYGHTGMAGSPEPTAGMRITDSEADQLFLRDIAPVEKCVSDAVKVDLTQSQFDALVSFTFNVGNGAFLKSTLLKKVNAKNFDAVPAEFMKWTRSGGKELLGLVRRRRAEAALWRGLDNASTKIAPSTVSVDLPVPSKPITQSTTAAAGAGGILSSIVVGYSTVKDGLGSAGDVKETINNAGALVGASGTHAMIIGGLVLIVGCFTYIIYARWKHLQEEGV